MNNNLTIVAVDTACHTLTKLAIDQAVKISGSTKVLVFSDQDIYTGATWIKTGPVDMVEYSRIIFKDLHKYITTDHYMIVQYDGMPTDAKFWDDAYLEYDYIGATWPWLPEDQNVGNGGFSIRSRKLAEACTDLEFSPTAMAANRFDRSAEDVHICQYYRSILNQRGIKFAPSALANKFSAENPGGKYNTYGFHGTLCLPYYLSDEHMSTYIDNLTVKMLANDKQVYILFGLCAAKRYEHVEQMMAKGSELTTSFKYNVLSQFDRDRARYRDYFPNLVRGYLEDLFVKY